MTENSRGGSSESSYAVVVNDEEQYSIWPYGRDLPPGWREAGFDGPQSECLEYIETHWTDMRPLSLRRRMEERSADESE